MNNYEYIRAKVPEDELLCQLMEECAELIAAANHLRRSNSDLNPTECESEAAWVLFTEEVADVLTVLTALGNFTSAVEIDEEVMANMRFKAQRWKERLKANDTEAE